MEDNSTQAKAIIDKYLLEECKISPVFADRTSKKVRRYDDIAQELLHWLETRSFDGVEHPIEINGYTARQIHEIAPRFDGVTVYDFMVDLREDPDWALKVIKDGFPVD